MFFYKKTWGKWNADEENEIAWAFKRFIEKGIYPQQNHVLLALEKYPLLKARGYDKVKNKVLNKIKSLRKTTSRFSMSVHIKDIFCKHLFGNLIIMLVVMRQTEHR